VLQMVSFLEVSPKMPCVLLFQRATYPDLIIQLIFGGYTNNEPPITVPMTYQSSF